jgi:hypothetical protein
MALTQAPANVRDWLVGHLAVAGFYVKEIVSFGIGSNGQIEVGRPNWRRRSAPRLSPGLELRLGTYAAENGIRDGGAIFPLSAEGIRLIVKRALSRVGERRDPSMGTLSSCLRELLQPGPQSLTALAQVLGARRGSIYKALRRMTDVSQVGGLKGRGRESVWSLRAPEGPGCQLPT